MSLGPKAESIAEQQFVQPEVRYGGMPHVHLTSANHANVKVISRETSPATLIPEARQQTINSEPLTIRGLRRATSHIHARRRASVA